MKVCECPANSRRVNSKRDSFHIFHCFGTFAVDLNMLYVIVTKASHSDYTLCRMCHYARRLTVYLIRVAQGRLSQKGRPMILCTALHTSCIHGILCIFRFLVNFITNITVSFSYLCFDTVAFVTCECL